MTTKNSTRTQDRTLGPIGMDVRAFDRSQDMGYSCNVCNASCASHFHKNAMVSGRTIEPTDLFTVTIGNMKLLVCREDLLNLSGHINRAFARSRMADRASYMTSSELAKALVERTVDAYSRDRYQSWAAVAKALLAAGYSLEESEAIMKSKWARWAADEYETTSRKPTAKDLLRWIENNTKDGDVAKLMHS